MLRALAATALAMAATCATADKYIDDAGEPESPETFCERMPGDRADCLRLYRATERRLAERSRNPPPATTKDVLVGLASVAAPLLLLWLVFFRK